MDSLFLKNVLKNQIKFLDLVYNPSSFTLSFPIAIRFIMSIVYDLLLVALTHYFFKFFCSQLLVLFQLLFDCFFYCLQLIKTISCCLHFKTSCVVNMLLPLTNHIFFLMCLQLHLFIQYPHFNILKFWYPVIRFVGWLLLSYLLYVKWLPRTPSPYNLQLTNPYSHLGVKMCLLLESNLQKPKL